MMPVVMLKKRIGFQLAIYFGTPSMYGFNTNPLPHAYMLTVHQPRAYMHAVGVIAFYTLTTITESILSPIFEFLAKNYIIQHMEGVICLLGPGNLWG